MTESAATQGRRRQAIMADNRRKPKTPPAPTSTEVAAPYEQTPAEVAAWETFVNRLRKAPPTTRLKVEKKADGPDVVAVDHPVPLVGQSNIMAALGTAEPVFFRGLLHELVNVANPGREVDADKTNYALTLVRGIGPQDQVEAMLAGQMAAVHMATMTFARRLGHAENIPQQDSAERAFNKLCRTFAAQVAALKGYRSTGEQKVTVQHVQVNEGGQAIVGNVMTGGPGGLNEKAEPTA